MKSLILVLMIVWCHSSEISGRGCLRAGTASNLWLRGGHGQTNSAKEIHSLEDLKHLAEQAQRFHEIEKMETMIQAGENQTDRIHEIPEENRANISLTEEVLEEDITAYDIKTLKSIIKDGNTEILERPVSVPSDMNATELSETNTSGMQNYSEFLDLKDYLKDVQEAREIVSGLICRRHEAEEQLKILESILHRKQMKANQMLWHCATVGDIAGLEKARSCDPLLPSVLHISLLSISVTERAPHGGISWQHRVSGGGKRCPWASSVLSRELIHAWEAFEIGILCQLHFCSPEVKKFLLLRASSLLRQGGRRSITLLNEGTRRLWVPDGWCLPYEFAPGGCLASSRKRSHA
eukprot:687846-Hanusia_phi.AAC.1